MSFAPARLKGWAEYWMGSGAEAGTEPDVDAPLAGRSAEEILEHPYLPTIADIMVVKQMLMKSFELPVELIDNIVDQAEYWLHTCSHVNYSTEDGPLSHTIGRSADSEDPENEFLLRTDPLGFPAWPPQSPSLRSGKPLHRTSIPPRRPGGELPPESFHKLMGYPSPLVQHPCRKIVFTIRSYDQGWGGNPNDRGTYHGSFTWFEAGLERWTKRSGANPGALQQQPSLALEDLATVYPRVVTENEGDANFDHPLHPIENLKIQCNKTATRGATEHRVEWRHNDDMDPDDPAAAAQLAAVGRGKATGDGKFVRELQLGDIVTVWGKTRFPGWSNHVESVKVEVYWFV